MPVHGVMLLHIPCLVDVFFLAFYHSVRVNHSREAGWEHQQRRLAFHQTKGGSCPPLSKIAIRADPVHSSPTVPVTLWLRDSYALRAQNATPVGTYHTT